MKSLHRNLILIFSAVFLIHLSIQAQTYILNGTAQQNTCNCYTLTTAATGQSGSVWNAFKINLTNPFDFNFNVYLGCLDGTGADGIVFMLQPISTSIGSSGGGLGFQGISPSVGVTLDTWQNTENNDPAYDHISIQTNGNLTHGSDLAGPVQASASSANIEDCNWHVLRVSWDPVTHWLRSYFDGVLRLEVQNDIVANYFNGDPLVYWGFTGSTGGSYNLQKFCTALNPDFNTSFTNNATCLGNAVSFQNTSTSFAPIANFYWDFGDGTTSTLANPPAHIYANPGLYNVKLAITGLDGCASDTMRKTIAVGDKPVASFQVFDTCANNTLRIVDHSTVNVTNIDQWVWVLDNFHVSGVPQPIFNNLDPGLHSLKLVVKSNYGCVSDTVIQDFFIKPVPLLDADFVNGCINVPVNISGVQLDNATTISQWNWQLGDGANGLHQNMTHTYNNSGNYQLKLTADATNGCISDTLEKTIFINKAIAFAGNDTLVIPGIPFQLKGSGNGAFNWSPPTGLSDAEISNPTVTISDDMTYTLTVTTDEGCTEKDAVTIKVFKGSAVYVPTGFTPNGDGLNDILRPYLIGITQLDYFSVYNRWGQLVYTTKTIGQGWDGRIGGREATTGSFIWVLKAKDLLGKIYQLKGSVTLIK
ncbi:MAG: gliding motility-associated C-terminal domain-containing protein [Bacteroidetes bacterium]|nr:gliding motility-associated C-terminal domain-containing protein [Bacteroidota bacterium]